METIVYAVVGIALASGVYAVWQVFAQNIINVEPGRRERVVIQNNLGTLRVLGPGRHPVGPGWFLLEKVSINRVPIDVIGQEVKTSNGVVLRVDFRYDILIGRPFNRLNGLMTVPDPDEESGVDPKLITGVVTRIHDFATEHRKYVAQIVSAGAEETFAHYSDQQLMTPGALPHPFVPTQQIINRATAVDNRRRRYNWMRGLIQPAQVSTAAQLYEQLSRLIELVVNFRLRHIGINILSFQVTNLVYKDDQVQKSLELRARIERLRQAKPAGSTLTDAQLLAAGTDQLGNTSIGEGIRQAGQAIGDGLRHRGP